jgi:hypothetical protein
VAGEDGRTTPGRRSRRPGRPAIYHAYCRRRAASPVPAAKAVGTGGHGWPLDSYRPAAATCFASRRVLWPRRPICASWSTVTTTATGRGRGAGRKAIQRGRARAQPARARGRRGSLCRLARRSVSRRWLSPHGFRCGGQQNRLGQALRCRLGVAMFICALLSRRSSLLLLTKSQFNFPSISNQRWRHNKINLGGDSSSQNKYAPKFKLDAVI